MRKRYNLGKQSGAIWAISSEPEDIEFESIRSVDRLKIEDARSGLAAAELFVDTVGLRFPQMFWDPNKYFVLGFIDGALANYRPALDGGSRS